ncbi:MAG: hypothetical protein PHT07_23870, partial [Paludibacter sp.]|nr:hypothetical protein [Paludibacter sp.]
TKSGNENTVRQGNSGSVTVSTLATPDLSKRHNASNAITKISNDLSEPINVVHSNELKSKDKDSVVFYDNNKLTVVSDRIKSVSDLVKSLVHEVAVKNGLREVFAKADLSSSIGRQLAKFDDLSPDLSKLKENSPEAEKLSQIIRKAFGLTQSQFSNEDLMGIVKDSPESNDIRFKLDKALEDINKITSLPKTVKSDVPTLSERIMKIKAKKAAQDKINANRSSKPKEKDFANEHDFNEALSNWKENIKQELTPEEHEANLEARGNTFDKRPIKEIGRDLESKWIGQRDVNNAKATLEAQRQQEEIKKSFIKGGLAKSWQDVDKGIHLYAELGDDVNNDDVVGMEYRTDPQKEIIEIARNLTDKQKAIAEDIRKQYDELGKEALANDAIRSVLENYVGHIWNIPTKTTPQEFYGKFATKTGHAKHRVFNTIIDGWDQGFTLRIEGATNNLMVVKTEVNNAIEGKKLLEEGLRTYDENGQPLFTTKSGLPGYTKIDHYNFTKWKQTKKVKNTSKIPLNDENIRIDKEGSVFLKKNVYAPDWVANRLNTVLGGVKAPNWVNTLASANSIIKSVMLSYSFFHHMAFLRNYYLTTNFESLSQLNVRQAYKNGVGIAHEFGPEVDLLVRNWITIGRMQEFDELSLESKTKLGAWMDKNNIATPVRQWMNEVNEDHHNFLFKKLGPGLKLQGAIIELRRQMKLHPEVDPNELARGIGDMMGQQYGGMNLDRQHRNKTSQYIARMFTLAVDWTESNFRAMAKLFHFDYSKAEGSANQSEFWKSGFKAVPGWEHKMYMRMWGNVLLRSAVISTLVNLAMALVNDPDDEEEYWQTVERMYRDAFENPERLNFLHPNITPIRRLVSGKQEKETYFNLLGQFEDAFKLLYEPVQFMKNKGSFLSRTLLDALTGSNWQGKRFTSLSELTGTDDKGLYSTSNKAKGILAGEEKGGKHVGQLTRFSLPGENGALGYDQIPSFSLDVIRGMFPVPVQNAVTFTQGELDAWDAMTRGLGMKMTSAKQATTDYAGQAKEIITQATTYKNAIKESAKIKDIDLHSKLISDKDLTKSTAIIEHYNWRLKKLKNNLDRATENNDEANIQKFQKMIDDTNKEIVDKFSNTKFPESYHYKK